MYVLGAADCAPLLRGFHPIDDLFIVVYRELGLPEEEEELAVERPDAALDAAVGRLNAPDANAAEYAAAPRPK